MTISPKLGFLRWSIAATTAAIIIAGSVYVVRTNPAEFDANFFALLLTALLPTVVFVIGVRSPGSAVAYGSALLGVTLLGWIFVLDDDPMRAVGAVLTFPITLLISAAGAIHDQLRRRHVMPGE